MHNWYQHLFCYPAQKYQKQFSHSAVLGRESLHQNYCFLCTLWVHFLQCPESWKSDSCHLGNYLPIIWQAMNILKQPHLCEDEEQKSLITCTFEEPALLLVSLIGAILSCVPARDNLARPPKTRHTHTHIYIRMDQFGLHPHLCKKDVARRL